LSKIPKNGAALVRLGLINQRAGEVKKAQRQLEDAVSANPSYVPALVYLAELNADALGDKAKALELAKKARELAPADPRIAGTLGWVAYQSGDHTWAASLLGDAAANVPDDASIQYRAGMAALAMGKTDEAESAVRRALQISQTFAEAPDAAVFLKMAELTHAGAAGSDTLAQADAALKDRPDYLPALAARAAALDVARDAAAAQQAYEKILATYPSYAPAVTRLAMLYADNRVSNDAAFKVAQRARELQPDSAAAAGALGTLSYLRGQYDRAAQLLQESAGKDDDNASLQFYLGMTKYKQKNPGAAKTSLARALEIDPAFRYADEANKTLAEIK
jgi:Tfp pilus assembly protein PilF